MSSSLEDGHPLRARGVPHQMCGAGQGWSWDGVRFEVLHPAADALIQGTRPAKPNAVSCVLRIEDARGRSVLLTGDIEAAQEAALVDGQRERLRSDVLIVPHHGSRTSSTPAFLDAVSPSVAVVQAGYRNRFRHPAPIVLARYAQRNITVVRSDHCGAWTWRNGIGQCERDAGRRYWHFRADGQTSPAPAPVRGPEVASDVPRQQEEEHLKWPFMSR
jgi:competence protein ComEC